MNIEEVAFKDRKNLVQLNENDLLDIIEFLQLDRKQWINQFSKTHNESIDVQEENQELKLELSGYRQAILNNKEMLGLKEQNQALKKQLENYKKLGFKHLVDKNNNLETQQKEFIKWLEDYLNLFDYRDIQEQAGYDMLEEILQKYKSIIGGKHE